MYHSHEQYDAYSWGKDGTAGSMIRESIVRKLLGSDGSDLVMPTHISHLAPILRRSRTSLLLAALVEAEDTDSDRSDDVLQDLFDFVHSLLKGEQPGFVHDLLHDYEEMGVLPRRVCNFVEPDSAEVAELGASE